MSGPDYQADPFEDLYASAGEDLDSLPWAALEPQPQLVAWLAAHPPQSGETALVVGCGYGDDAAAVARRGWRTTAFDLAPTAIAHARRRFDGDQVGDRDPQASHSDRQVGDHQVGDRDPQASHSDLGIEFAVADVFDLPAAWSRAFTLVVEIRTLQSLPPDVRAGAMTAIAATVAPGGRAWVRCEAREDDEPVDRRPWPVSRRELETFGASGLRQLSLEEGTSERGPVFTALYTRPAQ
jgi:SAM-dependent methyltransferase